MYFCQIKSFSHQVFYSECNCFKKWTLSRQDKMLPAKVYTVVCSRLYVSHVPYYHFTLSLNVYQLTSGWEVDGVAARWEGCRTSGICRQVLSTFVSVTPLDHFDEGLFSSLGVQFTTYMKNRTYHHHPTKEKEDVSDLCGETKTDIWSQNMMFSKSWHKWFCA